MGLHVARRDGSLFRHQVRHERELADELVGVVGQDQPVVYRPAAFRPRPERAAGACQIALVIAHLDLDAFFAAVELHRNPGLRGKPVVVGGNPDGRGVVATASYEARRYGIRSAMSSAEARRRCPQVVFVRPDHRTYREWSRRVWALVREMAPVVEQVGIDEGYLVLPDGDPREQAELVQLRRARAHAALVLARRRHLQGRRQDRLGRPKARRHHGRAAGRGGGVPRPLPVRTLPGVGPKAEVRLVAAGVATIGALAELDDAGLPSCCPGRVGVELRLRARGIDPRPGERRARRGHLDLERGDVRRRRARPRGAPRPPAAMAEGMAAALERRGMSARTVTTKVRYPDFAIATRSQSLRGRHRRRRRRSATWRAACSTARYATGRDRSAWWAWGCPGSTGTGSSRCR